MTEPKLEAVLSRLKGVKREGRFHVARCPAHKDKNPSLRVRTDTRGIGVYCRAGCSTEAVLQALDLGWQDLFFDEPDSDRKPVRRRRDWRAIELESHACAMRLQMEEEVLKRLRFTRGWAAEALLLLGVGWDGSRLTLPVFDANGKLHDVLRYLPWSQRRKMLAGKGKSRLPWPAPELVETDTLLLVEGEGTAISLLSVGLRAVALPGSVPKPTTDIERPGRWQGAGWHRAWARRFTKFRYVVALPDCDFQGRALMHAAQYDLQRAGVDTRLLDLEPRSQDGRDIADMLLNGTYNGEMRRAAKEHIRELIAEQTEVLVA